MTASICKTASPGLARPRTYSCDLPAGLRKVIFRDSATEQMVVLCKGLAYYADIVQIHGASTAVIAELPDIFANRRGGAVRTAQISTFASVGLQGVQKEVLYA